MIVLLALPLVIAACGDGAGQATTTPGGDATTTPGDAGEAEVVMVNTSFQPDELTVSVGTTVTWTNQDSFAHTTTSEDDVWDSGNLAQGESFSFTFEEPGTYPYICQIHPEQMQGTITVTG